MVIVISWGSLLPSEVWYRAAVRSETPHLCRHQLWWCNKPPKGLQTTDISRSLVQSPCTTNQKPAASIKHGSLVPFCSPHISSKEEQTELLCKHRLDSTPCLGFCLASTRNLTKRNGKKLSNISPHNSSPSSLSAPTLHSEASVGFLDTYIICCLLGGPQDKKKEFK